MNCRHGRLLSALVLGLLAPVGCVRWQGCVPRMIVAEQPAGPSARGGELTPAQAAQLCLTAGEALEKKGFHAEALRQYENARKQAPQTPTVARHLAVLYDLQGDAAKAETEYLRALQEQPRDAELLNDFGYFHYRHNHLQTAESWLRNAIAVDPKCACAWSNLGQVLVYQGRAEESYRAFTHVLRPAEAYSNLGILLAKQGRTAEARNALQQAIKLDPRLMQPRAFLNALADTPGPLPPDLSHTPSPVLRMSAVKPAAPAPLPASKRMEMPYQPLQ
ncbi:MAG: tetratricopeptide repeat protein, partial [Gemmataceae bacterium]